MVTNETICDFKYAQILINFSKLDDKTFSYIIPEDLKSKIQIGQIVSVPFGMQGAVNGFVTGFSNYMPEGIKAKSIYEIIEEEPVFTLEYLNFLDWISKYYCVSIQTVIDAAVTLNFVGKIKKIVTLLDFDYFDFNFNASEEKIISLLKEKPVIFQQTLLKKSKLPSSKFYSAIRKLKSLNIINVETEIGEGAQKLKFEKYIKFVSSEDVTKRQKELLDRLQEEGEILLTEFLKNYKTTSQTVKNLKEKGKVVVFEKEVFRNPLKIFEGLKTDDKHKLSKEQQYAYEKIKEFVDEKDSTPILLHGVTGSGKTEIYFSLIEDVLKKGQTAMFLAPEIAVASQLAKRFVKRFGADSIALWHSSVSEGEKFDVLQKIKNNEIKIVIGARSAVFAPLKNVGIIIIDEEHEGAYKQTSPAPRYDAKKVAEERAKREGCSLLLGSATPDISSYYNAINSSHLVSLNERYGNATLAKVKIIDMRQELLRKNKSIFSNILRDAIKQNLEDKKQTLLLINRRGFSTSVYCAACGEILECPKCAIPLIMHKTSESLRCHYCNYETPMISACPKCGSDAIRTHGLGTQKVEEYVRKDFPTARVARMDSDIMGKKNAHIELLKDFEEGKIDILIGTQMIAKGLDNPNVTLVGVLMADQSFSLPDFRGSERGFQLLTQVAGRAGRGEDEGRVYFQTYVPDFFAIETAKKQDFKTFYKTEIENRYELAYPPYSKIIRLILSSDKDFRTEKISSEVAMRLKELVKNRGIEERLEVLGPSPCIISKIKGEYRYQILIKNRLEEKGHFLITNFVNKVKIPTDIKMLIDIDPLDML